MEGRDVAAFGDLMEAREALGRLRPWPAVAIAVTLSCLFAFYGPRSGDDRRRASELAVLESLRERAVADCNAEAKEKDDKATFSAASRLSISLGALPGGAEVPVVVVRDGDNACSDDIGGDATVYAGSGY